MTPAITGALRRDHGIPVNLRDALTGIDGRGTQLMVQAVLHASGHRPSSRFHDHL